MNFKVGEKVLCVNATSGNNGPWIGPKLELHKEYTIYGVMYCSSCGKQMVDVHTTSADHTPVVDTLTCNCNNTFKTNSPYHWCGNWRFVRSEEMNAVMEEVNSILEVKKEKV